MDKGIEAIREAVRRVPLTWPEGLSPEWQAYFDAVTPLQVSGLIDEVVEMRGRCVELELICDQSYLNSIKVGWKHC